MTCLRTQTPTCIEWVKASWPCFGEYLIVAFLICPRLPELVGLEPRGLPSRLSRMREMRRYSTQSKTGLKSTSPKCLLKSTWTATVSHSPVFIHPLYSLCYLCYMSLSYCILLPCILPMWSSQGVGHPWALSVQFGAECCVVVYPQHVRCGPSATLDIIIAPPPHLTLSTLCGRSSGRSGHVIVYSLCFPEPLAGTDWGDKPYNGHRVIAFLSLLHASICWTMDWCVINL